MKKACRHEHSHENRGDQTSAEYVTAFATGWPEHQPDIMVLSLTTQKGVQDFAVNKEQALLIAKTIKETAAQAREAEDAELAGKLPPGVDPTGSDQIRLERALFDSEISAPRNWLSARIVTVCLLPVVRSEMLALKPAVQATTWKLPPPPRPCREPETLRLASVQVPETCRPDRRHWRRG